MKWTSVNFASPPQGQFVHTKISDAQGERNNQKMKLVNNLWFGDDGAYVYYQPTHWAFIEECRWIRNATILDVY